MPETLAAIREYGALALFFIAFTAGARGVWVWGWQYREIREDRDWWRRVAEQLAGTAERGANVAERAAMALRR